MGLINHDPYPIRFSGQTKTDTYIHFPINSHVSVRKDQDAYIISSQATIRWCADCAIENRDPIDGLYVECRVDYATISSTPIFTILYNKIKETYTNFTDVI